MTETLTGKSVPEYIATVIKLPYLVLRSAATDLLFDRRYGVRTAGRFEPGELGLAGGRQGYRPAGWLSLRRILSPREVTDHDVFVDFGSGMGRVVLQAASYSFRRVIGVEVSETLHGIARENIDRNRRRLRCRDVELVHADVLDYEIPDDATVAFLYNPFQGEIFATVIERVLQSVERHPRPLRIIYVNPVEERLLLDTGRIRHVRTACGWRPNREWSRSNSIRMYETVEGETPSGHPTTSQAGEQLIALRYPPAVELPASRLMRTGYDMSHCSIAGGKVVATARRLMQGRGSK